MLHIIGLILKCIGILLLVLLGLLVLAVCAVLFCGLRYRLQASCEGTLESLQAKLTLSWLFRLVRADVKVQGTSVRYVLKVAWKTFLSSEQEVHSNPGTDLNPGTGSEPETHLKPEAEAPSEAKVHSEAEVRSIPAVRTESGQKEKPQEISEMKVIPEAKRRPEKENRQRKSEKAGFLKRIFEKLKAIYQKIKYTFEQICDKMKMLLEKKEAAAAFIEDPVHRLAFAKGTAELKRFLKHFRPDKCKAELVFGCSDPYLTGKVLAGLGIMYPFLGEDVYITPDFEQKILKGHIFLKGHFRISHILSAVLRMLLHKPTRITISHIRKLLR